MATRKAPKASIKDRLEMCQQMLDETRLALERAESRKDMLERENKDLNKSLANMRRLAEMRGAMYSNFIGFIVEMDGDFSVGTGCHSIARLLHFRKERE